MESVAETGLILVGAPTRITGSVKAQRVKPDAGTRLGYRSLYLRFRPVDAAWVADLREDQLRLYRLREGVRRIYRGFARSARKARYFRNSQRISLLLSRADIERLRAEGAGRGEDSLAAVASAAVARKAVIDYVRRLEKQPGVRGGARRAGISRT